MPPPAKKPAKRPRSLLRKVVTLENGLFVLLLMSSYFLLRRAIHRRIYGSAATSSEGLSSEDAEVLSSDMDTAAYDDGDGDDGPSPSRKNRVQAFGDDGKPKHAYTYTLSHRKNVAHSINNKTLPTVKGLPIYLSAKRLPKDDVFVSQENYDRLMQGYASECTSRSCRAEHDLYKRAYPDAEMKLLDRFNFTECAVVGSSGHLLNSSLGGAIDSHPVVLRINQAPTNPKFRRHVGMKTTFRLINTRWTNKYGDTRFLDGTKEGLGPTGQGLPLEEDLTLVVTRAKPKRFDEMVQYMRLARPDVNVLYLSSRVVTQARRLLVSYRTRLASKGFGPYFGGSTPSSGFVGLYMLMNMCERVTVYGFGLDADDGRAQEYHYFHLFSDGAEKNRMNPTHSFDVEDILMRALAESSMVKRCIFLQGMRKHNKNCGRVYMPPAPVSFSNGRSGGGGDDDSYETNVRTRADGSIYVRSRRKKNKDSAAAAAAAAAAAEEEEAEANGQGVFELDI
ncbi:sialyltransferase [Pycnococcus provasolii]